MPRVAPKDGHDKFSRYRATKRRQGMKLLRIWVPDPTAPGFAEEAERQAKLLRGHPSEREAMEFIEAVLADMDLPPYDWGPDGPPIDEAKPEVGKGEPE